MINKILIVSMLLLVIISTVFFILQKPGEACFLILIAIFIKIGDKK
jgi:hypothetical protein